jgi:hypothetical protein
MAEPQTLSLEKLKILQKLIVVSQLMPWVPDKYWIKLKSVMYEIFLIQNNVKAVSCIPILFLYLSNHKMTVELWTAKDTEWNSQGLSICFEWLRKTAKTLIWVVVSRTVCKLCTSSIDDRGIIIWANLLRYSNLGFHNISPYYLHKINKWGAVWWNYLRPNRGDGTVSNYATQ